jgi:signal transduction histidine kinase
MESIQGLDTGEAEARERTAAELGRWLGSPAAFLPPAEQQPETAPFWSYFNASEARVVHRLRPPDPRLASLLTRLDLHAVFPLRVEGRLEGLLALGASATGGGYADDELEAVRLVIRQLAATLALGRLLSARIAEERRLGERERLSMLGLISASLAHEIKNPLSAMKALAQALRTRPAAADSGPRSPPRGRTTGRARPRGRCPPGSPRTARLLAGSADAVTASAIVRPYRLEAASRLPVAKGNR